MMKLNEKLDIFTNYFEIPIHFSKEFKKHYPKGFDKFLKKYKKSKSLYLYGEPGTGKTLNALSFVFNKTKKTLEYPYEELFTFKNITKLLYDVRQTFGNNKRNEENLTPEEVILYSCLKPDYLILDDLGAEKTSDFSIQTLYLIINSRYENMKPTIITSNLSIEDLYEKMEDNRVISRIQSMCQIVKCTRQYRNV